MMRGLMSAVLVAASVIGAGACHRRDQQVELFIGVTERLLA